MEKEFERKYHSLEKEHWWFISRRDIILKIVKKFEKNIKILEIGCSSGRLMNALKEAKFEEIIGIDISKEAIRFCREDQIKNIIQMDGSKMGFKEKEFDLIIASDILEHIYDDHHAIREWKRVLKEKGIILAFVPAFNLLWSDHDVVNRHLRRYSKKDVKALFERNGLSIVRISYWNFFLFFPIFIKRVILNKIRKPSRPKDDLFRMNRAANVFSCLLLTLENIYCSFFNLPLGVSLFIIAKK